MTGQLTATLPYYFNMIKTNSSSSRIARVQVSGGRWDVARELRGRSALRENECLTLNRRKKQAGFRRQLKVGLLIQHHVVAAGPMEQASRARLRAPGSTARAENEP